jgi:leucyl aminopeptidase (aminopeptidase T)
MNKQDSDLRETAFVFVKELLNLKRGERLLIYVDQGSDYYTAKIIEDSAQQMGALTELFELNSDLKLPDMARELTQKIEKGAFDVICELSEQYFYQSLAWKRARQLGSRIYSLAGMDADAFTRCVGKVNHNLMFQFGMALRGILKKAESIQILTKKGTHIKFQMKANPVFRFILRLRRKQKPRIFTPSGKPIQRGQSSFLGGQLAFLGIPRTIEGTALIDGYLWPPKEIRHIDVPIILKIRRGSVIEINGCPLKSKILNRWFEGKAKKIQHFCIGFNPGAKLKGELSEAERVFGYISIGIGKYPFHTDGIIKNPSILSNDEIIEQDGSFIQKELSSLEQNLIQQYQNRRRQS